MPDTLATLFHPELSPQGLEQIIIAEAGLTLRVQNDDGTIEIEASGGAKITLSSNGITIEAPEVKLDGNGGTWVYTVGDAAHELTVPWSGPIAERPQIRVEIVKLYDAACERLGIEPRPHE